MILIFDEIISFRLATGGAQALYGVKPDLTTFGKIIGGGLPIGAFGGKGDIMDIFSPKRKDCMHHSGTFNGNAITMAAGIAALKEIDDQLIDKINGAGDRLRKSLQQLFVKKGIHAQVTGMGSCFQIHFVGEPVKNTRDLTRAKNDILVPSLLNLALLNRGMYLSKKASGYLSVVNTEEEIDSLLDAFHDSLKEIRPVIEEETPELILR